MSDFLPKREGSHLRYPTSISNRMPESIHQKSDVGEPYPYSPWDVLVVLESITDGFIALDPDWRFIYVNGPAEKMLGFPKAELLGRTHWEMYPGTLGTIGEQNYRKAVAEQVTVEFEYFYDVWQKWYAIKAYPTKEGGLSVFFRDITQAKALYEEQQQQWKTFDVLLSNTPDHAYVLDRSGRFIYANRAVLTLWQTTLHQLQHQKIHELPLPPELSARLANDVHSVLTTGETVRHEATFRDLAGDVRCYDYIFSPILAADGSVEAIAGSSRDVTERDGREKLLQERARLNGLGSDVGKALTQLESLPIALQRCAHAMVQHLDGAFARIWTIQPGGATLELQASAGQYTHLNGPHARIPVGAFKIGRIAEERKPHLTNDVLHDDRISDPAWAKKEGMVAFAGYPLIVEGRLVGVLALFARKSLGQDVLDAIASVADSIAVGIERKRAELILSAQTEQLARSNEDLQQFAYITSHDLQEPLRTMANFSQLLLKRFDGHLDGEAKEFLGYIASAAQRMKALMDSLLSYTQVVSLESLPFNSVSLETILQSALANLHTAVSESHAVVTHDPLPAVNADQALLVQLLQNLIGNGIKYGKPGEEPRIHLWAWQQDHNCVLAIRDNGIGVDSEHLDRIFGVFKRLHGKEIPGAGMGLAICKRIVEKHGGRIWVDSTPGEGSTFYVALPLLTQA